jgi:glucose-1-phosphate thymidylyltransferase
MVYYPISVLMLAGIRDILIISTPHDLNSYQRLLGNGSRFGVKFDYAKQGKPNGIAEAFIIAEDFIEDSNVCLILGDNIFYGQNFSPLLKSAVSRLKGATVFGYQVNDPHRFGVIEFDDYQNVKSIEEKPKFPKSNFAVTGLYFYDNSVIEIAKTIEPSSRCELEISDVNQIYLNERLLNVELLGRGFTWLDTGTYDSLNEASNFVRTIEQHQGFKIACLEEIAHANTWIANRDLENAINLNAQTSYGIYLQKYLKRISIGKR